jgi:hypothetical protein
MGHFKSFMLGMLTAYGVYFITRKGPEGTSILDDLLENPAQYLRSAKEELLGDAAKVVKEIIV